MHHLHTTRRLTPPTPDPLHLTTTRLHSRDIRDIHQHREDIQVGNVVDFALLYYDIILRIPTNHWLPWWLPSSWQLPARSWQLSSPSSSAGPSSVWISRRSPRWLPLQASSRSARRSHEPSSTWRLPWLRPEQIRPPTSWLWSSPALVISYSNCSSKQSYGNLKKSMNVSYSVSYVCTCTYINIGY